MLDPYALKIFIDGSALENPGGAGGVAGIVQYPDSWGRPDEQIFDVGYRETTNNRMELRALLTALQYARETASRPRVSRVQIITDSLYLNNNYRRAEAWRHNDWKNLAGKAVENSDLWKEFLSLWGKQKIRVDIVWRKGKKSPILKQVDKAAKKAATQPWEADRGFRPGKVGRSKSGQGTSSSLYPAKQQVTVIRVYRSGIVGRAAHKITFEEYDTSKQAFGNKFTAFAATAELAAELHRGHCYKVRFNGEPKHPQILEIIEADPQI